MADSGLRTVLIFLIICCALVFVFREDVAKFAGIKLEPAAQPVNIDPEALQKVYNSLKIEPLEEQLAAKPVIAKALKDLTVSLCDKTAIFRLSNGLAKEGERKPAATAFLGFADACPNSEGELYAGANILYGISGDMCGRRLIGKDFFLIALRLAGCSHVSGLFVQPEAAGPDEIRA